jgi:hypothetical protein
MKDTKYFPDLIAAVNQTMRIAHVQSGDKVVFIADRGVDMGVAHAVWGGVNSRGAHFHLCMVEEPTIWSVPELFEETVSKADIVFHCWPGGNGALARKLRKEKGQRWISMTYARDLDTFISQATLFPIELMAMLITKTFQRIDKGRDVLVRITDPKGTDLAFPISTKELAMMRKIPFWQGKLIADYPGARSTIPLTHGPNIFHSGMGMAARSANGIVIPDSIAGFHGAYSGGFGDSAFAQPVKLHFENGKCSLVEGGWEAQVVDGLIQGMGRELNEVGLGFNPKFPTDSGKITGMAGSNHAGAVHIAVGVPGAALGSAEHVDACLFQATLKVDDDIIIDRGRLTVIDDEEIRTMAKEYGDPNTILLEVN